MGDSQLGQIDDCPNATLKWAKGTRLRSRSSSAQRASRLPPLPLPPPRSYRPSMWLGVFLRPLSVFQADSDSRSALAFLFPAPRPTPPQSSGTAGGHGFAVSLTRLQSGWGRTAFPGAGEEGTGS